MTFHATQNPGTKHESDTIVEIKKGPIPGGATRSWVVDMEMPIMDVYNMGTCRYIDIDYEFKVWGPQYLYSLLKLFETTIKGQHI